MGAFYLFERGSLRISNGDAALQLDIDLYDFLFRPTEPSGPREISTLWSSFTAHLLRYLPHFSEQEPRNYGNRLVNKWVRSSPLGEPRQSEAVTPGIVDYRS